MNFDLLTIDDLGKLGRGRSRNRPRDDQSLYGGIYPFIQTGNVKNAPFYITSYSQTYNEKGLAQSKLWKCGTLCITIAANIADTAILAIDACFPDSILGFTSFKEKSNVKFVKYCFNVYKTTLEAISKGTTQDNLSLDKLRKIKFRIPNPTIQLKIAAVLSAYDDLIENNNRRIAILEKMAEELYREWFVRLRFPGHEKTKIINGLPEGWKVKMLSDVASVVDCLHTKKPVKIESGEGWLIQLENIKENGRFRKSYKFLIAKLDYDEWTKNIEVQEGDCLITNVGRIAAVAQIPRGVKAALGRNMTAVRPLKISQSFLIQYLLSTHMEEEVSKKQDSGAIMGALNVRAINKLEMIIPESTIMKKFDKIVYPIRINLWGLFEKNDMLSLSRDRLLSRLMSGKIDVENLDIRFPDSMKEDATANA